jgi:hypothetical protein
MGVGEEELLVIFSFSFKMVGRYSRYVMCKVNVNAGLWIPASGWNVPLSWRTRAKTSPTRQVTTCPRPVPWRFLQKTGKNVSSDV